MVLATSINVNDFVMEGSLCLLLQWRVWPEGCRYFGVLGILFSYFEIDLFVKEVIFGRFIFCIIVLKLIWIFLFGQDFVLSIFFVMFNYIIGLG